MRLWGYLKDKMQAFRDKVAIVNIGITYGEILSYPENGEGKTVICDGSGAEQAVHILRCIASGNVAVPVTKAYGAERYDEICREIENDKNKYPDLAFIMFTSGTTGKAKGVMLTDTNIITNLEYISGYFDLTTMERICISRPLVHIAVLTGELLYALTKGMSIYFYEKPFNPVALLRCLKQESIDVFCSTPTVCSALTRFSRSALPIRAAAISGERLTEKTARALYEKNPDVAFYNVYGLTEHSPRAAALPPKDFVRKAGSIGKPIGNVEMRIENGELLIRSPCVMKGYYKKEGTERIRDGWLYTGDAAHIDNDGYFYIDGRKDDMIIRAGVNIFPQEIESVLKQCPGVEECVAYGEDDMLYGQKIVVKVRGTVTSAQLRQFAARNLPPHLIPNEYRFNEPIEYTASGKLKRK